MKHPVSRNHHHHYPSLPAPAPAPPPPPRYSRLARQKAAAASNRIASGKMAKFRNTVFIFIVCAFISYAVLFSAKQRNMETGNLLSQTESGYILLSKQLQRLRTSKFLHSPYVLNNHESSQNQTQDSSVEEEEKEGDKDQDQQKSQDAKKNMDLRIKERIAERIHDEKLFIDQNQVESKSEVDSDPRKTMKESFEELKGEKEEKGEKEKAEGEGDETEGKENNENKGDKENEHGANNVETITSTEKGKEEGEGGRSENGGSKKETEFSENILNGRKKLEMIRSEGEEEGENKNDESKKTMQGMVENQNEEKEGDSDVDISLETGDEGGKGNGSENKLSMEEGQRKLEEEETLKREREKILEEKAKLMEEKLVLEQEKHKLEEEKKKLEEEKRVEDERKKELLKKSKEEEEREKQEERIKEEERKKEERKNEENKSSSVNNSQMQKENEFKKETQTQTQSQPQTKPKNEAQKQNSPPKPKIIPAEECKSRTEQSKFWHEIISEPSPELAKMMREYEIFHRECHAQVHTLPKLLEKREPLPCKYLIWYANWDGMGNRLLSLISSYFYAMLTGRVLYIARFFSFEEMFCDPFPQTSIFLPEFVNSNAVWKDAMMIDGIKDNIRVDDYGNGTRSYNMSIPYAFRLQVTDALAHTFFCGTEIDFIEQVPFLMLRSNQFFLPGLYLTKYKDDMEKLFPDGVAFTHLARNFLFPVNRIWERISSFYEENLAHADKVVSMQLRTFNDPWNPKHSQNLLGCANERGMLPNLNSGRYLTQGSDQTEHGKKIRIACVVASLHSEFHNHLKANYSNWVGEKGEVVTLHRASQEKEQLSESLQHNELVIMEMWLLSFGDYIITSPGSTFGYIANGMAGKVPYLINGLFHNLNLGPVLCKPSDSAEPCFHWPPLKISCPLDPPFDIPWQGIPNMKRCCDFPRGMRVLRHNSSSVTALATS